MLMHLLYIRLYSLIWQYEYRAANESITLRFKDEILNLVTAAA